MKCIGCGFLSWNNAASRIRGTVQAEWGRDHAIGLSNPVAIRRDVLERCDP